MVGGCRTFTSIHQEQDDIRLFDGHHGLPADMIDHLILGAVIDTTGVYEHKKLVVPDDALIVAVSGHPGGGINQGLAGPGYPVEQRYGIGGIRVGLTKILD